MYADLLADARAKGRLTALEVTTEPERVTQRLGQHRARLWAHLAAGGHFYACGGAFGFGPAVTRAMVDDVFQGAGGLSPAGAAQLLTDLLAADRYLEDLSD